MSNNFGTRQNNDYQKSSSTNTTVYQFRNKDGFMPSTLQISGWDDMFSMKMYPALEASKQTKEQVFDYTQFVATSLNMEKALLLADKINKDILSAIESDSEKNVGISVGGDSLIVVGTGKKLTGSVRPYIAIHKSLDPDTKKPKSSIYYEFRKNITIDDYDVDNGHYSVSEEYNSELNLFVELLKSYIAASNFAGHSSKYAMKYTMDKLIGNNTTGSTNYSRKNVFDNGSSNNSPRYNNMESSSLEEIGDLNALMND